MATSTTNPAPAAATANPATPPLTRAQILADIRASEARIMQALQGLEKRMGTKLDTIKGAVAPNATMSTPATVRGIFSRPGQRVPTQITGPGVVKPAAVPAAVATVTAAPAPAAPSTPAKS